MSDFPPAASSSTHPPLQHPKSTTILVLGLLSALLCAILGPFAWSMGSSALREIDGSQATARPLGGRGMVQAGRILGIIATAVLAIYVLVGVYTLLDPTGGMF